MVDVFTQVDYPTFSELLAAQKDLTDNPKKFIVSSDIAGALLTGFSQGLTVVAENQNIKLTGKTTVNTTGLIVFDGLEINEIEGMAAANVEIINGNVNAVLPTSATPSELYPNSAFLTDGTTNFNGIAYFNQIPNFGI